VTDDRPGCDHGERVSTALTEDTSPPPPSLAVKVPLNSPLNTTLTAAAFQGDTAQRRKHGTFVPGLPHPSAHPFPLDHSFDLNSCT